MVEGINIVSCSKDFISTLKNSRSVFLNATKNKITSLNKRSYNFFVDKVCIVERALSNSFLKLKSKTLSLGIDVLCASTDDFVKQKVNIEKVNIQMVRRITRDKIIININESLKSYASIQKKCADAKSKLGIRVKTVSDKVSSDIKRNFQKCNIKNNLVASLKESKEIFLSSYFTALEEGEKKIREEKIRKERNKQPNVNKVRAKVVDRDTTVETVYTKDIKPIVVGRITEEQKKRVLKSVNATKEQKRQKNEAPVHSGIRLLNFTRKIKPPFISQVNTKKAILTSMKTKAKDSLYRKIHSTTQYLNNAHNSIIKVSNEKKSRIIKGVKTIATVTSEKLNFLGVKVISVKNTIAEAIMNRFDTVDAYSRLLEEQNKELRKINREKMEELRRLRDNLIEKKRMEELHPNLPQGPSVQQGFTSRGSLMIFISIILTIVEFASLYIIFVFK